MAEFSPTEVRKRTTTVTPAVATHKKGNRDQDLKVDAPNAVHNFSDIKTKGHEVKNKTCGHTFANKSYCPYGGACHTCPVRVQAKLKVNQPGDKYEQEADRIAESIMSAPVPDIQRKDSPSCGNEKEQKVILTKPISQQITPLIQRQADEDEEDDTIQAKQIGVHRPIVNGSIANEINNSRGLGSKLPVNTQRFMEGRFGADFSNVRIHDDSRSVGINSRLNSRAFTIGRDIYFNNGYYKPNEPEGKKLLAHELTHIMQQRGRSKNELEIQRKVNEKIKEIRSKLSYSYKDWAVREYEVRDVLNILKSLNDEDLRDSLAELGEKLTDRIYTKIGNKESLLEASTLDRIRRLRPGKSLLTHIPSALVCDEPSKGDWEMARSFKDLDDMVKIVASIAKKTPPPAGPRLFAKLGILAHGDQGGVIKIGTTVVNVKNIEGYQPKFAELENYMISSGTFYLFGCISGAGRDGSALLKKISLMLPGRRVIGFNTITLISEAEAKEPGPDLCYWPDIKATDIKSELFKNQIKQRVPAKEYAPQAKIALNGKIIKWPSDENPKYDDSVSKQKNDTPRLIQEKTSKSKHKQKKVKSKKIQRKTSEVNSNINNPASQVVNDIPHFIGQALNLESRAFFESKLGHNFNQVRIHTNANAANLAKSINARAFTLGTNIFFDTGQYSPKSSEGQKLLAHELTHTIQQKKANVAHKTFSEVAGETNIKRINQQLLTGETVYVQRQPKTGRDANLLDEKAKKIIEAAKDMKKSIEQRAIDAVNSIVKTYYAPSLVEKVIYDEKEPGLSTSPIRKENNIKGKIYVGKYFIENIDFFARRVLQVGHELQHIQQQRSGIGGHANKNVREFLAFHWEATQPEKEKTGRMPHATRTTLIDGALSNYYCMSDADQKTHTDKKEELLKLRKTEESMSGRKHIEPPKVCEKK